MVLNSQQIDWYRPDQQKVKLTDNQLLIKRLLEPLIFTPKSTLGELIECAEIVPPVLDDDRAFMKAVIVYGVANLQHGKIVSRSITDILVDAGIVRSDLIEDYKRYSADMIRILHVVHLQEPWTGNDVDRELEFQRLLNDCWL